MLSEDICAFAKDSLFPRMKELEIDIELIPGLLLKEGVFGDCEHIDDRSFTIRIDPNIRMKEFVATLCHEMVHVRQYARKELYEYARNPKKTRWRKTQYYTEMKYENRPWEKEAHRLEGKLSKNYIKERGLKYCAYRVAQSLKLNSQNIVRL